MSIKGLRRLPALSIIMAYEIAGKVAMVTGGGNGIGRAICVGLAQNGAKVVIIDKNELDGNSTKSEIDKIVNSTSLFIACDVTKTEAIKSAVEATTRAFGKLDILVNGAGTMDERLTGWKSMIDLNLIALVEISRLVIDHYMSPGGVIINISSIAAFEPSPIPIYAATKGGATSFSMALGGKQSFEHTKVRVMAIQPGMTNTQLAMPRNFLKKQWIPGYTTDNVSEDLNEKGQRPEKVAECVVEALRIGNSGSIWTVIDGKWTVENPA